jgi:putative nucleotidyltransferase with HDIG domain
MRPTVRAYVGLVAAAAALCWASADWAITSADASKQWNALAAFALLAFVSEASYLRLRVGAGETNASVAFVPTIASVMLLDAGWAVAIAAAAELSVEFAVRRKPPIKMVFNVSQLIVAVFLSCTTYAALGGKPSLDAFRLHPLAIAGAIAAYFAVNICAVSVAVAIGDRIPLGAALGRIAGSLAYDLFSSLLSPLLALLYVMWQVPGLLLVIVPLYFVRHLYHVTLQLEQVNRDLLELMVKAIEARDPYTSGHSQRVSQLAEALANQLGLGNRHVEQIRTAALLHDVGKIYEQYAPLLRKEGRLDATEKALMQTHSLRSAELVGTISAFRGPIEDAVRHHHENFDGSGYPRGLAGKSIPVGARIIMIADTVDAMTTDRPYRKALSYERVANELARCSGTQFDPELVSVFLASAFIRELVARRVGPAEGLILSPVELRPSTWRGTLRHLPKEEPHAGDSRVPSARRSVVFGPD